MIAGLLLGLGASVCWAVANVAVQRATRAVGVVRALVWAQLAGGALVAIVAAVVDRPTAPWTTPVVAWAAVGGVAACLAYLGLFHATAHGRLSVVVPIISSWALLSTAVGVVVLGEALRAANLAGAVLVVAGGALVARGAARDDPTHARREERQALWAAVAAAVGFGMLIPAIDQVTPAAGSLGAVVVVFALDLAITVPFARARGISVAPPSRAAWAGVGLAGLLEVLGFAAASIGTTRAPLTVVAPAASISAPLTAIWAWLILHERPGGQVATGTALSAVGVLLLGL